MMVTLKLTFFVLFGLLSGIAKSEESFNLIGLRFKANFLSRDCKIEEDRISCFDKQNGSMIVISVATKESEDDFALYSKVLKTKKVNLPLISKPLENEVVMHEKRRWIYSTHLNAEIPDYYTAYYLAVINQRVLLLSYSAKDKDKLVEFRKTSFPKLGLL